MRLKFFFSTLALMLALCVTAAHAQQVASGSEAPKDEPLKVSGRMYLEWYKTLQNQTDSGENKNTFNIKRVYLDFRKKIDAVWSIRATLDVGNENKEAVSINDSRYTAYIKFAVLQAQQDLGFGILTAQFGMIGTPVIGLIDEASDYRWLNQNYLDAAKMLLLKQSGVTGGIGQSIDFSADMGLSVSLNVAKMVTVTGAVTNGEGYKRTDELQFHDDGKAFYGMITVTPIEGLSLAGFYRNQITRDNGENADDNFIRNYGAVAAYNFQGIRVGASFTLATVSTNGTTPGVDARVAEYRIIDAFLMANLNSLTGMPILVAGRYAMGSTEYADGYGANDGVKADVTIWAFGVGYQFNNFVRMMAYVEDQKAETSDPALAAAADWKASNRNFYIKTEAKF